MVLSSVVDWLTLFVMLSIFWLSARFFAIGALSLPCMTMLTGLAYFYLFPILFRLSGEYSFFGLVMTSMAGPHLAIMLYSLGAGAAFLAGRRTLAADPAIRRAGDRPLSILAIWFFVGIGFAVALIQARLGLLSFGDGGGETAQDAWEGVRFLNLGFSVLIPATVVLLVHDRFGPRSLVVLGITLLIFILAAFRFRVLILLASTVIAFMLSRHRRPKTWHVAVGSIVMLMAMNAFGLARTYGRGLNTSLLTNVGFGGLIQGVGAEIGPVFVLSHLTDRLPTPLIGMDPLLIAFSRLVPSYFWPDKPIPYYLDYYWEGFPEPSAVTAGIAGTQHAEALLQYGWWGIFPLAFAFFGVVVLSVRAINRLTYEVRVAGCAIVPALFGFYAQQRGYLFQLLCEALFTLGPLLIIHLASRRIARRAPHRYSFPDASAKQGGVPNFRQSSLRQPDGP